jgi:hypothetical protein
MTLTDIANGRPAGQPCGGVVAVIVPPIAGAAVRRQYRMYGGKRTGPEAAA